MNNNFSLATKLDPTAADRTVSPVMQTYKCFRLLKKTFEKSIFLFYIDYLT